MACEFKVVRRVEFSETDMAGIVHFSHFFRYMESAEHAFFRSVGSSVTLPDSGGLLGLPRVRAECEYLRPLRFEDEVEIQLWVVGKGARSLRYLFRFRQVNGPEPVDVARGRMTVVCVRREADGVFRAVPLPSPLAERIEVAPRELWQAWG